MKCPHCTTDFHDNERTQLIDQDQDGYWGFGQSRCSACGRIVIRLFAADEYYSVSGNRGAFGTEIRSYLVRPKIAGRPPVPSEVPDEFSVDYKEACLVLSDSTKASAALSRRCLQKIIREKVGVKKQDLFKEIQELIDSHNLPSHIAESLDAIRVVGNFAAHPIKSQSTGEIVEVEPGEAEWNLDVLESLFDYYFVAPARTALRKAQLNQKLQDAGKPPMQ